MLRVVHVISGLKTGGAEMMLYKLLSRTDRSSFEPMVISLSEVGAVGARISGLDISVQSLEMRSGGDVPWAVGSLVHLLRRMNPDVVQTWMYHADLIGGLAAQIARVRAVAWNLRQSSFEPRLSKRSTLLTARVCASLSHHIPNRIVCCSEASRRVHSDLGYRADNMVVIPNGFDLTAYRPDVEARNSVRQELGVGVDTVLIGLVARFDPQKDHRNFVTAARILHERWPYVHFLLCGDGIDARNSNLVGWIGGATLCQNMHLLGRRDDIPRLTAALDIAGTSSSFGEGFPNVVGEAMACGVPCIVTDVGDSAMIVGDTGVVVPPRSPEALAAAWEHLLELGPEAKRSLGLNARSRVERCFDLARIARRYESLYEELATHVRSSRLS